MALTYLQGLTFAGCRVRHLKRGSKYTVIGPCMLVEGQRIVDMATVQVRLHVGHGIVTALARLQTDDPKRDAQWCAHMILYVADEDNSSWVRHEQEFTDGRFVPCDDQ